MNKEIVRERKGGRDSEGERMKEIVSECERERGRKR
jgi:hypothetical protein